ncbi:HAMP domain-containing histidine kinase, partial [Acinetobacter sp. WCHAc060033]|uniref:sensor histidine kinase n=1 Tax=Acinetobacter sp. WCHAc060033 TaxID=2518624 RepID=UPI00102308FF
ARSTEEAREAAEDIMIGIDKTSRMITQLLTLARIEPNAHQIQGSVDLVNMIQSTLMMMDFQIRQAKVDLQLQLESALVMAQPEQLEIMLRNLLENAIIYRSHERPCVIKISCGCVENYSFVQIEDNGIGLDEAQIPLIFQRFYRVNQNSVIIGSGLGLSIVKQIVDLYHGKVELHRTNAIGGLIVRIEFNHQN